MTLMTWVLILSGVALNATAQLVLKVATKPLAQFTVFNAATLSSSIAILCKSLPFWAGMICYGASLCVWLAALSKAPVSTAYPMLSLGYVIVAVYAFFWLGESVTPAKIAGIACICLGVVLVTRSSV